MTRIFLLALSLFLALPQVALAATAKTHASARTAKTATKHTTLTKHTVTHKKAIATTTPTHTKNASHHTVKSSRHSRHTHYHVAQSNSAPTLLAANVPNSQVIATPVNTADTVVPTNRYMRWASSVEHKLVGMVQNTIRNLHYSNYRMGGSDFDPTRGIYVLDCSDYVDHLLNQANPQAYYSLVNGTGTDKPTTADYYRFFNRLPVVANNASWRRISNVGDAQPGDILVFRGMGSGHVMVVMDKPVPVSNNDVFLVRVADSARSGHSQDTRPLHASGIGIGTMLLKVDPRTEQLAAYSWKMGAPWKSNVNFAIARPANA